MTKQEAVENHRKMWNWIANQIEKDEELKDVIDLKQKYCEIYNHYLLHNCFCCEYCNSFFYLDCSKCPVEWPSTASNFMCEFKDIESEKNDGCDGLWIECANMLDEPEYYTWEEQAELARQIANLPERNVDNDIR